MMRISGAWGRAALLTAALIWGSSFIVMKNAVDAIPVFVLLGIRFGIGCLLLCLLLGRKLQAIGAKQLIRGGIIGVLLFLAYTTQTYGLKGTTPGKNAFLTAVYCVLVPFVNWLILRRRPSRWNWIAAVMCLGGIGLVSLDGDLRINPGDALTLVGGVFYALHMVAVSRFGEDEDPVTLTMLQFGAGAVCCLIFAVVTGQLPTVMPSGAGVWLELGYLSVFATTVALLCQNVGQSVTPAAPAAILLSLESVFGVAFSVLLGAEGLTLRLIAGFVLIFLAVIASETQFSFVRRKHEA